MDKKNLKIKETKLKVLSPTLREKKRFIKVKIESSKKYEFKELSNTLTSEITYYIGAIDYGKAGIWFLKDKFDFNKQEFIIKVGTKFKDKLIGSLALITKLNSKDIKLNVIKVSGTLKNVNTPLKNKE